MILTVSFQNILLFAQIFNQSNYDNQYLHFRRVLIDVVVDYFDNLDIAPDN